jgi:hypothetical protein
MLRFRNVLVVVAVAFPILVAGNAVADRRVNSLDAATALRHRACGMPRRSPPLTLKVASPAPRAPGSNDGAIPQPLDEVVDNGHGCAGDPRDWTPQSEVALRHRRLLVKNRFETTPLFESTISNPSR